MPPEPSDPGTFSRSAGRIASLSWKRHLEAYGGREAIDYVMDCVDHIAGTAANAPFHLERGGTELVLERTEKTRAYSREAPPDLVRLLRYPNPWQDWSEFTSLLVIDFLLVGNAFWLKSNINEDGKPTMLIRLDPRQVTVVAGDTRPVSHYEFRVEGSSKPREYRPDEIIHFKRPNPHSDQVGLGLISGGPRVFDIELAMTESQAAYFENGTRVSGVLESERTVPEPIMAKVKRQFAGLYAGAKNSYRVPVLERGMKFKAISASAAEAEFRYLAPQSRERIASMFKLPLILLGLYQNADRQAVREAQRIFDNKTMVPFLGQLARKITMELTLLWGCDLVYDYAYEMPIEDRIELVEKLGAVPGFRVREIRELAGYEPLGADVKGPDGKPVDDYVLNLPGNDDNDSAVKDRQGTGRPPDPENTRRLDDGAAAREDAEVVSS